MLMQGKQGLICGVANKRSIAHSIAKSLHREGARLAFTYQGERLKKTSKKSQASWAANCCTTAM